LFTFYLLRRSILNGQSLSDGCSQRGCRKRDHGEVPVRNQTLSGHPIPMVHCCVNSKLAGLNMPIIRRRALILTAPFALASGGARAIPTISDTLRIVVGAAPGGGADTIARLLLEPLAGRYAPQVIVVNRPGASSRLAPEAVKSAAPDGSTLLLSPMPVLTLFPQVLPKTTRYDTLADFTPVTTVGEVAYGFVVRANHPARDLKDFLARAKQQGSVTFAPPVLGAPQHLLGLTLARQAGISFTVVSYRDATGPVQDLLGGRVDSFMSHMAQLAPHVRDGRMRLLAVSSEDRLPSFPASPTFAEMGFSDLTGAEAFSVMLPQGAPNVVVNALHGAIATAVAEPALRERLARLEMTPLVLTPAETGARIRREYAAWGPVVSASGFRPEE
jgi:tripartite-type tricarboxylate transporter receptor subunit TctC